MSRRAKAGAAEELEQLRREVEDLVGGSVAPWWDAVVALRTGPLTLEHLAAALDVLRTAPLAVSRAMAPRSSVAVAFVTAALRRGCKTEAELVAALPDHGLAEIRAALVEIQARPPAPPRDRRTAELRPVASGGRRRALTRPCAVEELVESLSGRGSR